MKNSNPKNYDIPKNIAVSATPKNIRILEEEEKLLIRRQDKDKHKAEVMANLESLPELDGVPEFA